MECEAAGSGAVEEARVYIPKHFSARPGEVAGLLRPGLADLVTATPIGLLCTPLPLLHVPAADGPGRLLGHVARNNPQWRQPVVGEAMALFRGPDAYVSPSWYATKRKHGRVVPTWDYLTAHVYGHLVVHDDSAWVEDVVRRLTAVFEGGRAEPWLVDDAPRSFLEGQLRAVVGVELEITRIDAKSKLSQNRPADLDGVVAGLHQDGAGALADAVERARQDDAAAPAG